MWCLVAGLRVVVVVVVGATPLLACDFFLNMAVWVNVVSEKVRTEKRRTEREREREEEKNKKLGRSSSLLPVPASVLTVTSTLFHRRRAHTPPRSAGSLR